MNSRPRGRLLCLIGIGFLYVASVPWYRDVDAPLRIWLGLPDWVAVALFCYVGVAILNGLAWLWTDVRDDLAGDVFGEDAGGDVGEDAGGDAAADPEARE